MIFIVEHLDPHVWEWSLLEYAHISHHVGPENLWFTNVTKDAKKLAGLGKVFKESVTTMKLQNACILESAGKQTLKPADKKFDYFIFGGILGDYPEVNKSHVILKKMPQATVRNLGKDQMSTDTAVLVTKEVIDGTPMDKIPFQKGVEVEINDSECVDLPYKYIVRDGEPHLPPGLVEMLKKQKGF
jgi:ribosome biogenesis SPOUT family RNA methylase Rps3